MTPRPSHSLARRFACADCGVCTFCAGEYYVVRHQLWRNHGVGNRMLCIGCLEKRLGRRLVRADFIRCEANADQCFHSRRLISRLLDDSSACAGARQHAAQQKAVRR